MQMKAGVATSKEAKQAASQNASARERMVTMVEWYRKIHQEGIIILNYICLITQFQNI